MVRPTSRAAAIDLAEAMRAVVCGSWTSSRPAPDDLAYRVDANGRIRFVNDRWDDFARDNGAPELAGAAIIGRLISEFISGAETWHLYGMLTRRAQPVSRPFSLRFRCDAPHAQRFMQMRMEALDDGQIEVRSYALRFAARSGGGVDAREPSAIRHDCCTSAAGATAAKWTACGWRSIKW